jgi:hypothetical protein
MVCLRKRCICFLIPTITVPTRSAQVFFQRLQRQIARFGASSAGMPSLVVYEGTDGVLVVYNGLTRATRIAKLAPGTLVRVEVIGRLRRAYGPDPKIGDLLP